MRADSGMPSTILSAFCIVKVEKGNGAVVAEAPNAVAAAALASPASDASTAGRSEGFPCVLLAAVPIIHKQGLPDFKIQAHPLGEQKSSIFSSAANTNLEMKTVALVSLCFVATQALTCSTSGSRGSPPRKCPSGMSCKITYQGRPEVDIPNHGICVKTVTTKKTKTNKYSANYNKAYAAFNAADIDHSGTITFGGAYQVNIHFSAV